jgi:hypothetical protein
MLLAAVVGCTSTATGQGDAASGPAAASVPGHHHGAGGALVSEPVGDGTTAAEVGYSLRPLSTPETAGQPGALRFVVENFRGRPHTEFLTEQTKKMHVYVVRDDFAVFRHVHPEMAEDGTWTGNLTLPEPGDYRVVTEFVARDDGGNGDHLILGEHFTVPGEWEPQAARPAAATTWGVEASVLGRVAAGREELLRVRLTTPDGGLPSLGQYLGTSAHLTGFHEETGGVVHMHPLGSPVSSADGAELQFHAELPAAGRYRLFLQVVADDFLHTLPIEITAA